MLDIEVYSGSIFGSCFFKERGAEMIEESGIGVLSRSLARCFFASRVIKTLARYATTQEVTDDQAIHEAIKFLTDVLTGIPNDIPPELSNESIRAAEDYNTAYLAVKEETRNKDAFKDYISTLLKTAQAVSEGRAEKEDVSDLREFFYYIGKGGLTKIESVNSIHEGMALRI